MTDPELEKTILSMLQIILEIHQDITMIKMETANIHRIFNKVNEDEPAKKLSKKQAQRIDLEKRIADEKLNLVKKIIQS